MKSLLLRQAILKMGLLCILAMAVLVVMEKSMSRVRSTTGPWLGEIAEVGATRVEGQTAVQYVYTSILDPNAFIAPDCPNGPCVSPSAMLKDFGSRMSTNSPQDMIDLLAYLLGE